MAAELAGGALGLRRERVNYPYEAICSVDEGAWVFPGWVVLGLLSRPRASLRKRIAQDVICLVLEALDSR
jgi:hypothetical protein